MSSIRFLTMSFESGTKESLSLAAVPSIMLATRSAAGLARVSQMVCGFQCFPIR